MNRYVSPPVAFAIAILGMWLVQDRVNLGRFQFAYQGVLAGALVAIGLVLAAMALVSFKRAGTTANPVNPALSSQLVTSGVYRITRNPMYVGDAIMLAGAGVWLGSAPALVFVVAFIAFIDRAQIAVEEAALEQRFGRAYGAYRQRVRRWL